MATGTDGKRIGRSVLTLLDLFRIVSDEARSDDEVVAVVADLMNRRCVRRAAPALHNPLPVT